MTSKPVHTVGDYAVFVGTTPCEVQGAMYALTYEVHNTVTGVIEYVHPQLISALTAAELFSFQLEKKMYRPENAFGEAADFPGLPFHILDTEDKPN